MTSRAARSAAWVIGNAVAAIIYLYLSSVTWLEPELRGEGVATSGDAVIWFVTALPVFVLAMAVDLAVVIWVAYRRRRHGAWLIASWSWVILAIWLGTYAIDLYHH